MTHDQSWPVGAATDDEFVPFTHGQPPQPEPDAPRVVGLHPQDLTWTRRVAVRLRARGVADEKVDEIITEAVDTFVRRGRHAAEVHGSPREFAKRQRHGVASHPGHRLRTRLGVPLIVLALVLAVVAILSGLWLPVVAAALLLGAAGAFAYVRGTRLDAPVPEHLQPFTGRPVSSLGW